MTCRKHVWRFETNCCSLCGVPLEITIFPATYFLWLLAQQASGEVKS
jgi:hypothetical protein